MSYNTSTTPTTPFMVMALSPSPTDGHSPPRLVRTLGTADTTDTTSERTPSDEIRDTLRKFGDAEKYLSEIGARLTPTPASTSPEGRCSSALVIAAELQAEICEDFFKEVVRLINKNDLDFLARFMVRARETGHQLSSRQTIDCLGKINPKNKKMLSYFESLATPPARPNSPAP